MRFLPHGEPEATAVAVRRAVDGQRSIVRWRRGRGAVAEAAISDAFDDLGRASRFTGTWASASFDWVVQSCAVWAGRNETSPVPSLADAPDVPDAVASTVREVEADRAARRVAHAAALAREVSDARLYVADADLVSVLLDAAEGMPDSPLLDSDAIDTSGLLWFAQPIALRSSMTAPDGEVIDVEARLAGLLWREQPDDDGRPGLSIRMVLLSSREAIGIDMPGRPGVSVADSTVTWPYGFTLEEAWDAYRSADPKASRSKTLLMLWRFTATFWHLSRQRITTTELVRPAKAVRSNAARAGIRIPDDGITVIALRHAAGASAGSGQPDRAHTGYRVRWAVRGHWRQQWYPSLGLNRPVFIHPYLKGPDGAPFKDSTTVWVATGADLKESVE